MKKIYKTPLAAAMGTALATTFSVNVQAEGNPFAMSDLAGGYMQTAEQGYSVVPYEGEGEGEAKAKPKEGSCGEGRCGAMMDGDKMKKGMESSCGAMMKGKEGACGMKKEGKPEMCMKDGEMKCGAKCMKGDEMKCGAMMKGGEMKCGDKVKTEE